MVETVGAAELPAEVDVVVVGAGSAGCVLASRLSAATDRQVLVVEAGPVIATEVSRTPGSAFYALGSDALYPAATVPQAGLAGRAVPLPTGRGLGGSSTVNLLAWFQGDPADYDGWEAAGAAGWGWASVGPVFRDIEHFAYGADEFHGAGGPMVIDTPRDLEPVLLKLLAAGERVGLPVNGDLNGRSGPPQHACGRVLQVSHS